MELSLYSNINVNDIDNNNCKFEILNNNHIVKTEWLRSLILDVFPFEYSKLVSKFGNFNYSDLDALAREIANTPGVFEHGLFLKLAALAIIADEGKVRKISI